ncbi:bone morphogenetic protein 2-like [Sardina pilchardus]|uniref:bone morphogenetic protein 2-like n=1 Tax=Sardina pilchardus TaxID=27697 RepID=UPI002E14E2E2
MYSKAAAVQGSPVESSSSAGQPSGEFHYFDVSSLGAEESVTRAELRWYRRKQPPLLDTAHGPHLYKVDLYEVDLYEVLDSRAHPWRGNLLSSRLLPTHTQGWELFNLTQTVSRWVQSGGTNNGLLLVASLASGRWVEGVTGSANAHAHTHANVPAYLVVFSHDGKRASTSDHSSHERDGDDVISSRGGRDRKRRSAPDDDDDDSAPCHRKSLYVDFRRIGWSSWIISPRGYDAYQCRGACPFPLGHAGLRASNHATVQAIVRALRLSNDEGGGGPNEGGGGPDEGGGGPCCVPDALTAISLLYFDEQDNVVLKQYQDMVAASCGCH